MSVTLFVIGVFFCATLVRSALGFGEALIAVPLVVFVLPIEIAAPVAILVSIHAGFSSPFTVACSQAVRRCSSMRC